MMLLIANNKIARLSPTQYIRTFFVILTHSHSLSIYLFDEEALNSFILYIILYIFFLFCLSLACLLYTFVNLCVCACVVIGIVATASIIHRHLAKWHYVGKIKGSLSIYPTPPNHHRCRRRRRGIY